ncbi:MAG: hypothetical protein KTR30_22210 [Saprospiraceae bacterium]|nr:hypothetical protein [Saprospiraceae bacterium]
MSKEEQEERKDPYDGEYIGNIWGWRNSFIGLGVILFMLAVLGIRAVTMDPLPEEGGSVEPTEELETVPPQDTVAAPPKTEE